MRKVILLLVLCMLPLQAQDWSQKSNGPGLRGEHTAVVHEGKMYVYGGWEDDLTETRQGSVRKSTNSRFANYRDLWQYDINANTWTQKAEAPESRECHSAVVYNGKMYVFAGLSEGFTKNDILCYDIAGNSWSQVFANGTLPNNRGYHSAVVYQDCMYIFGGYYEDYMSGSVIFYNDLWKFDFATQTWTLLTPAAPPAIRACQRAVVYNDHLYVFGGMDLQGPRNDLWKYSFVDNTWTQITCNETCPSARITPSLVVDQDKMYLFAGAGGTNMNRVPLNDLWEFDFTTGTWLELTSTAPAIRYAHSGIVSDNKMYIFGGMNQTAMLNDLWAYQLPVPPPPPENGDE